MGEFLLGVILTLNLVTVPVMLSLDTYGSSYHQANRACIKHASGSEVRRFDFQTATCANGAIVTFRSGKND